MADHEDLVAEMALLEQLGTQERQKLAKKRRLQQLKKWGQREKEWIAKEKQLNKRLANKLNEENNGLNLKQYTIYNSNQRTKKKLVNNNNSNNNNNHASQLIISNNNTNNNVDSTNKNNTHLLNEVTNHSNNNNNNNNDNNNIVVDRPFANRHEKILTPNGRVHFDVGVMLLEAAARNDFDEVKRLLSLGVSPDSINHDGLTALHQCCIDASEPMMNLLLEYGANVDARDTERWTPLHAACTCGHLNLVKILVDYQADLLAVNGDGNMPFDICEDEETLNFIESQMVKRGITQEMIDVTRGSAERQMLNELEKLVAQDRYDELNGADANGVTALHVAASNNYLSVVKFLLKHDVNVNVCDNDQWRPLHGVACWGNEQHIKVVELLVEAGASLDAKTQNDETVFDLCDNIDLLERLNQLKDELENRQASGTDRLRRTQSRTNSRVHSVRRTSVRDKNQISRREAREEALLRVESETSVAPANGEQQQQSSSLTNGLTTTTTTTTTLQVQLTSSGDQPNQTKQPILASEQPPLQHRETNLDQIDGVDSANSSGSNESTGTSNIGKIDDHQQNRSQPPHLVESDATHSPNGVDYNQAKVTGSRLIIDEDHNPDLPTRKKSQTAEMRNNQKDLTVMIATNNNNISGQAASNNNCDSLHQRSLSQTSTVQVQYAPINYTLSNLKKHRSDLRMRTSTIGGHNNGLSTSLTPPPAPAPVPAPPPPPTTPATTTVTSLNGYANERQSSASLPVEGVMKCITPATITTSATTGVVQLHPEPSESTRLANEVNGRGRPESPGQTFRKFHGEPSEAIGDDVGRQTRHRCCILI